MTVRFDAAGDRLLRTANLLDINANYTAEFWLYITTDTNTYVSFFSLNNNTAATALDVVGTDSNGTTLSVITVDNGGSVSVTTGTNLSTGTWYHIALVRASVSSRIVYLNGVQDINDTTNPGTRTTSTRMELGALSSSNNYPLNGRIANIRLYDTNLTQAQIQSQMYKYVPSITANLVGWYPCLPGATERLMDYSGLVRNFTAGGTLTDEDPPPIGWGGSPYLIIPPAGGTLYTQDVGGTVVPAGALVMSTAVIKSGSITPPGAIIKTISNFQTGTITPTGNKIADVAKSFSGSVTPTGELTAVKIIMQSLEGAITPVGTLIKQAAILVAGTVGSSGTVIKSTAVSQSGSITPTGSLSAIKTFIMSLGGGITPSGATQASISKLISGAVSSSGVVRNSVGKLLTGSITPSGAVTAVKAYLLSLSGAITPSGGLTRYVSVTLTATLSLAGGLIRSLSIALTGTVIPSGVVTPFSGAADLIKAKARGMWRGMFKGMS